MRPPAEAISADRSRGFSRRRSGKVGPLLLPALSAAKSALRRDEGSAVLGEPVVG